MNEIMNTTETMSSREIAELYGKLHKNVLHKIRTLESAYTQVFGGRLNFKPSCYINSQNKEQPELLLNKSQALFVASRFDAVLHARVQKRWEELEANKSKPIVDSSDVREFEMQLLSLEVLSRMMKYSEPSKLELIHKLHKDSGLKTTSLPVYVHNQKVAKSASWLLKANNLPLSAVAFNKLMIMEGFLEVQERASHSKGIKKFKSITEKGLKYGHNSVSPNNKLETQPHYYSDSFMELYNLVSM